MDISKLDINFASGKAEEKIEWINSRDERFGVYGVFFSEKENLYTRVPKEVCEASGNPALHELAKMTSGGRLRFVTNSKFVAIKAALTATYPAPNMSITLSHGFSVYTDGVYKSRYSPSFKHFLDVKEFGCDKKLLFAEKNNVAETNEERLVEIYFPLYGGVFELYVGVEEGAVIKKAPEYANLKPLVFYGSSITQGACVSRPGNDYVSIIARRLNMDYINLGFSGNGNAEDAMIDYVTSIDAWGRIYQDTFVLQQKE